VEGALATVCPHSCHPADRLLRSADFSPVNCRLQTAFSALSLKTHQRQELSRFVGECTYEFPSNQIGISDLELLKWLLTGELGHVGKHTARSDGWYRIVL